MFVHPVITELESIDCVMAIRSPIGEPLTPEIIEVSVGFGTDVHGMC